LRVILVEDEPAVARYLSNQVAAFGYQVLGLARDPDGAVELAWRTLPDLALIEIPSGNGWDGVRVAQELRARFGVSPVFVTGDGCDELLQRAQAAQPLGYILKPFRTAELRATLLVAATQHRLSFASEQRGAGLRAILSSMDDGVIALDSSNRITFVNPATESLLGRGSEELVGRHFEEIAGVLDAAAVLALPPATSLHIALKLPDKTDRNLEVSLAPAERARSGPAGSVLVLRDVSERILAAKLIQRERDYLAGRLPVTGLEKERTRHELHALAASLMRAQEDERRRIAREIHDDLAQQAAALEMRTVTLEAALGGSRAEARRQIGELRASIRDLVESMRVFSHHLHPAVLEDLGLEIALRRYAEDYGRRENISILFRATQVPRDLPQAISSGFYRIAQEALRNIAKHSESDVAAISLSRVGARMRLTVRDRGKGFDPAGVRYKEGLGLISMQERARAMSGHLRVFSRAGAGTLVVARAPLP
jgi:PAS domain S-box-containing protein